MQRRSGRIGVGGDSSLTNPSVTIDSIFFYGAGNAECYLDNVSHNPTGYLAAALVIPGDYDRNGIVGPEDYAAWKNAFGQCVTPGSGADGDGDGQMDAGDDSIWRNNLGAGSGGGTASSDVVPLPEPASRLLAICRLLPAFDRSLRKTKRKLRKNR
jgi:hypothetical protein